MDTKTPLTPEQILDEKINSFTIHERDPDTPENYCYSHRNVVKAMKLYAAQFQPADSKVREPLSYEQFLQKHYPSGIGSNHSYYKTFYECYLIGFRSSPAVEPSVNEITNLKCELAGVKGELIGLYEGLIVQNHPNKELMQKRIKELNT